MFVAAQQNQWDIVIRLITEFKISDFSWRNNHSNYFALHYAVQANRLDVVQVMFDNGADVNLSKQSQCVYSSLAPSL